MEHFASPLIILFLAAITPGPNNLIVMRMATSQGYWVAASAILVVALSGAAMTLLSGSLLGFLPSSATIVGTMLGCAILALIAAQAWAKAGQPMTESLPNHYNLAFLALFQLVNPKAWVLVGTVTASAAMHGLKVSVTATAVFLVTGICLSFWAGFGTIARRFLDNHDRQLVFDRVMAGALFVFALSLPLHIL